MKQESNYMRKIGLLLVFLGWCWQGLAQENSEEKIISEVTNMAKLLQEKKYTAYANYLYPGIIAMAGSKEKLIEATKNAMEQMQQNGVSITKISFGKPEKVLVVGSEWQTTVPQVFEMSHEGKAIISEYSLIAISNDAGLHWYFIDTSGKDLATLRQSLPNLSTELVVPERKQHVE